MTARQPIPYLCPLLSLVYAVDWWLSRAAYQQQLAWSALAALPLANTTPRETT